MCLAGSRPPVGHDPASTTDLRRVVTVKIDSSWDQDTGGDPRIWNGGTA